MRLIEDLGVIFLTETHKQKHRCGLYECPLCEKHFRADTYSVKSGRSTKCKDCRIIKFGIDKKKDKFVLNDKIHMTWKNMKQRCYNKKNPRYSVYGEKGVTVCAEWKNSFEKFQEWSLSHGYEEGLSIDKDILSEELGVYPHIYSPETCMWATKEQQVSCRSRKYNKKLPVMCSQKGYTVHDDTKRKLTKR